MSVENFKEYCATKNMSALRGMSEEGPSKDDLKFFQITENDFYLTVEDTLTSKYTK